MNKLQQMIKISEGFTYSVNVQYDIENVQKLSSYIPTDRTINLFKDFIKKKNGANILVGSYGTGKSHLITLLANLHSGKYIEHDYENLIEKIKSQNDELADQFEAKLKDDSRRLIVLPTIDAEDFEQSVLLAFIKALEKEGLNDLVPDIYFDSVLNKIANWKKEFKDINYKFEAILADEYLIEIELFKREVKNFNKEYYKLFKQIYPRVTGGSLFVPEYNYINNIPDFIKALDKPLKNKGYSGIDIIFDEFGYFLEHSIEKININMIQNLAELSNSGEIPLTLYFVAHKDFSQYNSSTSSAAVSEWRKVEGRFTRYDIHQDSHSIYELISRVVLKDKAIWEDFLYNRNEEFERITNNSSELSTFADIKEEYLKDYVVRGCYPLSPLSAYCLHKLSDKLAQSERTLFTFLSVNEKFSLLDFLVNHHEEHWINGDVIFDYFEPLMRSESRDSLIYNVWKEAKTALNKIHESHNTKKKIIKVLALIYVINDFDKIAPNIKFINQLLLGYENNIENDLEELAKEKIIFYRKSLEVYKFFEGSDIDIEGEISGFITKNRKDIDVIGILNREFLPHPLQPRRHNDTYHINRYFVNEFVNLSSFDNSVARMSTDNTVIDGKIIYAIPSDKDDLNIFREKAFKSSRIQNLVIVIPKFFINFGESINRYIAVKKLLENEVFLSQDPLLKDELKIYQDEIKEDIFNKLSNLLNNSFKNVFIFSKGMLLNIESKYKLQQELSNIVDSCFEKSIKINNEMINKNILTVTMKKIIENIITNIFNNVQEKNLGFNEYSAEHTVLKSVLLNTGILSDYELNYALDLKGVRDNNFREVFNVINSFFNEARKKEISFQSLYNTLKRIPYGLRNGVIPLLLAAYMKESISHIYIKRDSIYQDIDGKLLVQIIENPEKYTVSIDIWDSEREQYISNLEKIFDKYIDYGYRQKNRLGALYKGIKTYYMQLPKFTKVTDKLPLETIEFRNKISKDFTNFNKFFFEILTDKNIDVESINLMRVSKETLDNYLDNFRKYMNEEINTIFNGNNLDRPEYCVKKWYDNLEQGIKEHIFDLKTNLLFKHLEENSNDFLYGLIKKITGFEIKYLSDEIAKQFIVDLKLIKKKIEDFKLTKNESDELKIILEVKGEKIIRKFNDVKLSPLGDVLKKKIITDIDNIGRSVKEEEKAAIMMQVLKKIFK